MNLSRFLKRLIHGDAARVGVISPRNVVVWAFIALVALFLTHPAAGPAATSDSPLPWPAELDLDHGP